MGTLGHNMKLLGLGALGEVGLFVFSLGSLGHWDMAIGGLWDCLSVLRDFWEHSYLYCGVKMGPPIY